jgi:hypothetical protein
MMALTRVEIKLTIPAPLAYGKLGVHPVIPKNATLVFDIKLVFMERITLYKKKRNAIIQK